MYAICHTKSQDVLNCVKEMLKRGYKYPIIQVGQKLYKRLNKDQSQVTQVVKNKKRRFKINLKTGTIHREKCTMAKGLLVGAYLVRPKDTGLKTCKSCMA